MLARALQAGWAKAAEAGAIRAHHRAARRFGAFGENSFVMFPINTLYNERYIHIGHHSVIGPGVTLTVGMGPEQEMVTNPVITIGNGVRIGRGSAIIAHLGIVIEDDVYTGHNLFVTDQNHDYGDRSVPIGHLAAPEAPVRIGAGSWLGHGVTILPGVTVGRHCVIAAGAVVTRDVPDFSVAGGVPATLLQPASEKPSRQ